MGRQGKETCRICTKCYNIDTVTLYLLHCGFLHLQIVTANLGLSKCEPISLQSNWLLCSGISRCNTVNQSVSKGGHSHVAFDGCQNVGWLIPGMV